MLLQLNAVNFLLLTCWKVCGEIGFSFT